MMHIPSLKSKTKKSTISEITAPAELHMPLQAYKNVLQPIVAVGDLVAKYQKIAASDGFFASSLHSPVSGKVTTIETAYDFPHITIANDFQDTTLPHQPFDVGNLTTEEILQITASYGIEGSGGARFPTHTKYKNEAEITHFIINGAECEPYLSADYALMQQETEAILQAIQVVQRVIKAKQVVFGIEKQHKELKVLLLKTAKALQMEISIQLLPNTYPQGGELQLIKSVTKKELPKGSIPANYGVMVNNVGTLWAMHQAFFKGIPYTERIITVSGEKAKHKGNYKVALGTSVAHILKETGLEWNTEEQTVILGGPMMGKATHSPNTPVHKGNGGVLVIPNPTNKRYNCIQCGYCADVCPQHLMPMEFARYTSQPNTVKLQDFHLHDCIECGACAYTCPSDVPLMKSIFEGKKLLQNA